MILPLSISNAFRLIAAEPCPPRLSKSKSVYMSLALFIVHPRIETPSQLCYCLDFSETGEDMVVGMGALRHYKDESLDRLANLGNVAQFVSFGPDLQQRFSRISGFDPNHRFRT